MYNRSFQALKHDRFTMLHVQVSYLLGWSLLLTRLQSLEAMSRTRELLVQYVQDSDISSTLLDCLFQHIPQEEKLGTSASKRRHRQASVTTSSAAAAAARAAGTESVAFAVEALWPVQNEGLVILAGAIYGLMLLVLPACVRIWFAGLRDKSLASAIEAFTTAHCSPQLLAAEFSQVFELVIGCSLQPFEFSKRRAFVYILILSQASF